MPDYQKETYEAFIQELQEELKERKPDLGAVAAAMLDLRIEMDKAEAEFERHVAKMLLMQRKLDLCHRSVMQLLIAANNGKYPELPPQREFPELSRKG